MSRGGWLGNRIGPGSTLGVAPTHMATCGAMPDSKLPWGLILGEILLLVFGFVATFSDPHQSNRAQGSNTTETQPK